MGDVSDILGINIPKAAPMSALEETSKFLNDQKTKKATAPVKVKRPKGIKREVFDLIGKSGVVPMVQTKSSTNLFKTKRNTSKGKWLYSPIESSARNDSQAIFYHWVKADMHYADYPYAKFNVKQDKIVFTDEEYENHLIDVDWSKEQTLELLDLCFQYDLRWPVIYDRCSFYQQKTLEDILKRYFDISSKLQTIRNLINTTNKGHEFDYEKEKKRRLIQNNIFFKSKEEEMAENALRDELKMIESMLRKNKKLVKAATAQQNQKTKAIHAPIKLEKDIKQEDQPAIISAPGAPGDPNLKLLPSTSNPSSEIMAIPKPGKPYLQSTRLYLTDSNLVMSKTMIGKMNSYLKELGIPERPVPTKRVCDLVDKVRQDTLVLISLHNATKKKEKEIQGGGISKGNVKSSNKSSSRASKSDKPRQPKERTTKKEKVVEPAPIVAAPVAQAIPLPPPDHEFKIDNPDDIALFEGIDPYEDDPLMFVTGSSLQLQANSQQTKKRGRPSLAHSDELSAAEISAIESTNNNNTKKKARK